MIIGAMLHADLSGVLALLLLSAASVANAIRTSKEGPMIDAVGREYKLAGETTDTASDSQQQQNQEQLAVRVTSRPPGDATTIRIQCTATQMVILIHADLYNKYNYGGRHKLSPGEVCLGQAVHPCPPRCQAFAASDTEYVIEAELRDCGSMLTLSEDDLIYSNELTITPATAPHVITRTHKAVVSVACHYKRAHLVSSHHPHHAVSTPTKPPSDFTLKLMTDNWKKERSSKTLYMGDMLYIKASYIGSNQDSRRLFVDKCVATLEPDVASVPRYVFIENHGCFTDAKEETSNARFETRVRSNRLQVKNQRSRMENPFNSLEFKLEAFLFNKDPRNSVFITCELKATTQRSSPTDKACNYADSRWTHVDVNDGHDHLCSCCETTCTKDGSDADQNQDNLVVYGMETLDVTILTRE